MWNNRLWFENIEIEFSLPNNYQIFLAEVTIK